MHQGVETPCSMPAPLRGSGKVSKTIQRQAAKAQGRKGNAASQHSLCVLAPLRLGVKFLSLYWRRDAMESPGSREAAKAYSPGFQSRDRTTTVRFQATTERRYEARNVNDDMVPSLINDITTRVVPRRSCALLRASPSRTRCIRGLKPLLYACAAPRLWEIPAPLCGTGKCLLRSAALGTLARQFNAKPRRRKDAREMQPVSSLLCVLASLRLCVLALNSAVRIVPQSVLAQGRQGNLLVAAKRRRHIARDFNPGSERQPIDFELQRSVGVKPEVAMMSCCRLSPLTSPCGHYREDPAPCSGLRRLEHDASGG